MAIFSGRTIEIQTVRSEPQGGAPNMTDARFPVTYPQQSDVGAIRELTEACIAAVRTKDLERLLSVMTDDVVFLSASLGPICGKDAVAALYRESFSQGAQRLQVQWLSPPSTGPSPAPDNLACVALYVVLIAYVW